MSNRARTALALTLLLAVALALRLYRLGDVPFGFHPDEGHNALDALRIAAGWRPAFLPGNNGREPLYAYLMAAAIDTLGPTIRSARLTSAVAGALLVPAQYVLVRALPLPRQGRTALISAAFVALTFWPVAQSRYALRAVLLPLWVTLALLAWWLAIDPTTSRRKRSLGWGALAGACIGLAVHTHLIGRVLPLVLIVSTAWTALAGLWSRRRRRASPERRPAGPTPGDAASPERIDADSRASDALGAAQPRLGALAAALLTALIIAWPQLTFFRTQPEMLSYRADQVSVLNPAVNEGDLAGTLAENTRGLLGMATVRGDVSWYHNLPERPVLTDPLSTGALLFGLLIGSIALSGRFGRRRQHAAVLLAAALAATLAPSWLSIGAPNYVRLTGTWPVLFLLPALGLERAAAWLESRPTPALGRHAGRLLIVLALTLLAVTTTRDYFGRYADQPETYTAFNGAAVERGRQIAALADAAPTYVTPTIWRQSVIRYVNIEQPPTVFDPSAGLVWPSSGTPRYAFDPAEPGAAAAFGARWPAAERRTHTDRYGSHSLTTYTLPPDALPAASRSPTGPLPATFGKTITLQGVDISPSTVTPGGTVTVTLTWRAEAPTAVDHNLFVHLVTPDGATVGQHDGPPLGGSYTTDDWTPGEHIRQPLAIQINDSTPSGSLTIRTGWYDWRDGTRLPLPGDDDAALDAATVTVASPPAP